MVKISKLLLATIMIPIAMFASIGHISALNGDVSIVRDTKTIKAKAGSELEKSDVVKSSVGSVAQLVFNDKTIITVGSNTVFSIKEYIYDDKTPNAKFGVEKGYFKTVTGQIGKVAPDKFKLETKTATLGIRGTEFKGFVDESGNLFTVTTKGKTVVTSNIPNVPTSSTEVPAGYMTKATVKGVEPSKPFDINELKKLNEGLGGYAKNNTKQQPTKSDDSTVMASSNDNTTKEQTLQNQATTTNNITNLTTEVVRQVSNTGSTPKWADAYDTYLPGTSYTLDGYITSHIRYGDGTSSAGGIDYFNLQVDSSAIHILSGDKFYGTTLGGFKIDSEDSFSLTATGTNVYSDTYLKTIQDDAGADYMSWGYWQKHYYNTSVGENRTNFGYWMGGTLTTLQDLISLEAANTVANYSGKVAGTVNNTDIMGDGLANSIITSSSSVNLRVDFGAAKSITGNIQFSTTDNQTWKVGINSSGGFDTSMNGITIYNSSLSSSTHTLDASSRIDGAFYGAKASGIGGGFELVDNVAKKTAVGVFKATKQ